MPAARRLRIPATPSLLGQLRDALQRADFSTPSILRLLGNERLTELSCRNPRLLYAVRSDHPLHNLVRLFIIGVPVALEQAELALRPIPLATLAELGILRLSARTATPLISILPHGDLLLASDLGFVKPRAVDYVPGTSDSSIFLELATIRRPFDTALDFGAGCGLQALRASLHCGRVVASDANRRALDFARFNAALNGLSNIDFVAGDAFEPVAGRSFGLIVANLPFAIAPSRRYIYRDSGMPLDQFARRFVTEAPARLEEGGYCQLLCQWVEVEGQDWHDRLHEWFDGSGCDVWVMKNDSRASDAYAEKWIKDTEVAPIEDSAAQFDEWMAFYESQRVVAIHSGAVTMRKRQGENWLRMDDAPERAASPFGEAILRAFALTDYLRERRDSDLLEERLRISPDIHMVQRCEWSSGSWRADAAQLRFHRDLEYVANIDHHVAGLVGGANGERTVAELIRQLAVEAGLPEERLRPACLTLIRGLIERGFLLPAWAFRT